MKTSRYLVTSQSRFISDGQSLRLGYATRSGTFFALPSETMTALESGRITDLDEGLLESLVESKVIVPYEQDEREEVLSYQDGKNSDAGHRTFVLLPSQWCNLGCDYCGQEHLRQPLSQDHRAVVNARVEDALRSSEVRSVHIGWFGAEPMVGYQAIQQMSRQWVKLAEQLGKTYSASMVTNGSLLNESKIRCLVDECAVTRYDITVDGPERVHNVHRPSKKGPGSYRQIFSALAHFRDMELTRPVGVILRTNVDSRNHSWVDEHLADLAAGGFTTDRFTINLAPVYTWSNDISAIELDGKIFGQLEVGWMRNMHNLGLNFSVIPDGPVGSICSAVTQSAEVVSATGSVFSCTEFPLVPKHEREDVLISVVDLKLSMKRPAGPFDGWTQSLRKDAYPCSSCTFLPVCGGSCPKQWINGERPCPTYKYDIQSRFNLLAEMSDMEIEAVAK